jgi:hypothetical protein
MRLLAVLFAVFVTTASSAATNNLTDCAETAVQSAINAAADGDVLVCPQGSWSWSNVNLENKNVTLRGAGIGRTRIAITAAGGIEATARNTKPFQITGFTFASTGNFGTDSGLAMMRIHGGKGWRVNGNRFEIFSSTNDYNGGNGIHTRNEVSGVIDRNEFVKGAGPGCMHAAVYPEGAGATAWSWASQIDKADRTVFIEDNYFYNPDPCTSHGVHAVYGQNGGIFVARYNEIHGMNIDAHGFCSTHGTREFEISNNRWIGVGSNSVYAVIHLRGGTGVVYGNSLSGNIVHAYQYSDWRAEGRSCGGNTVYYGAVASSSCPEGYPCVQQVGRGQNNSADPIYIWNNAGASSSSNLAPSFIQSGRDYILNRGAKPGYTPHPYPHPLTIGSSGATAPAPARPSPPTNLRVVK